MLYQVYYYDKNKNEDFTLIRANNLVELARGIISKGLKSEDLITYIEIPNDYK